MKELLTPSTLIPVQQFNGGAEDRKISRRFFIGGITVAAIIATAKPKGVFASENYAAEDWRRSVNSLVNSICYEPQRISNVVNRATVYTTPYGNSFHESFSPNYVLNIRVQPEETITGRIFEFDRFPFYDSRNPCRRTKDLNSLEIWRLTQPGEIQWHGGVLSPCSERRIANKFELEDFSRTANHYRTNPEDWDHVYTRNVTDGRKSYLAHAVSSRTTRTQSGRPAKNLLVSPYDLFN